MRDPYFGHRDWFTGEELDDREAWTDWDFALVASLQIIEDNTDKHGLLSWETACDRVDIKANKKIDKFQAAVDRQTKGTKTKGYQASPGEYFVPEVDLRGGEMPTYKEYIENLIKKNTDGTME